MTIPNVFKLQRAAALDALRRAGVESEVSEDGNLCGSSIEGAIIETGEVCYQFPPAGRVQGPRSSVTIRVQSEDPRHGNIGKVNEWRLMPVLVGLTHDQALAALKAAKFDDQEKLSITRVEEPGCKPNIVCRQYPSALERSGIRNGKVLYIGKDPTRVADDKPATPTAPPTAPTTPVPPTEPAKPTTPTAGDLF